MSPQNGQPDLVLVPTRLEREQIPPVEWGGLAERGAAGEILGFGPVAAAARAVQLIALHQPRRVVLLGIAGRLTSDVPLGMAFEATDVWLDGVGVGAGDTFQGAGELGWPQIQTAQHKIGDHLPLSDATGHRLGLVTVCAAAASPQEAVARSRRFPGAVAEEMEGFSVALACRLMGVPCHLVRGISNDAGDRDHSRWLVATAMRSAWERVVSLLASGSDSPRGEMN